MGLPDRRRAIAQQRHLAVRIHGAELGRVQQPVLAASQHMFVLQAQLSRQPQHLLHIE
jgi:hypothetical protein